MTFDYTFGLDLPVLKKMISTEQFALSEEFQHQFFAYAKKEIRPAALNLTIFEKVEMR